ncbi:MAG: hypothetical protein EXS63_09740, partial [Candidatus Omnitrophica bacterium]|nr:hypothetical protein [Candidatus Omnitrophota bacterium]
EKKVYDEATKKRIFMRMLAHHIARLTIHAPHKNSGITPFSVSRPDKGNSEDDRQWQEKISIYQSTLSGFESGLRQRVLEIYPELETLEASDRDQFIQYFLLGGLRYLDGTYRVRFGGVPGRNYVGHFLNASSWKNPVQVLSFMIQNFKQFEDPYRAYHYFHKDPVFESLVGADNNKRRNVYLNKLISELLEYVNWNTKNISLDEMLELTRTALIYQRLNPNHVESISSESGDVHYPQQLMAILYRKIETAAQMKAVHENLADLVSRDIDNSAALELWINQVKNKEELLAALEWMMASQRWHKQAVAKLDIFMKTLVERFGEDPEATIRYLDGLIFKSGLEPKWKMNKYDRFNSKDWAESGKFLYPEFFSEAYVVLISKISNLDEQKALIHRYYQKYEHKSMMLFEPSEWITIYEEGPLIEFIQSVLNQSQMSAKDQLLYFAENGYIPTDEMIRQIQSPEDQREIFDRIVANEQVFLASGMLQERFNDMVSALVWNWFFDHDPTHENRPIASLRDLTAKLRPSGYNTHFNRALRDLYDFNSLSEEDWQILFRLTPAFLERDLDVPSNSYWDTNPGIKSNNELNVWANLLLEKWLDQHGKSLDDPSWPLEEKLELIFKLYPVKSQHRNQILLPLIGDPLRDSAQKFEFIFTELADGDIKEILAKRIILARKEANPPKTPAEAQALIAEWLPADSDLGEELLNDMLQEIQVTVDELYEHRQENGLDHMAQDRGKSIAHFVAEHLTDQIENLTPDSKVEIFEWLTGIRKEKPSGIHFLESRFNMDLTDLAKILELGSSSSRYMFIANLFIGPKGILNSKTSREKLLKSIFLAGTGETPDDKNTLFAVFEAIFECSPELKQLDLMAGVFSHFLDTKPGDPAGKNLLIKKMLVSFGVVGVKFGQILSRQKFITDAELKALLEDLSDKVDALDKRYLLEAMLHDHSLEDLREQIEWIGRLLGSASIKQGYLIRKKDGTYKAGKYIRPMARYEAKENMEILRKVLQRLRGRIPELDQVSDTLIDELEKTVERELNMPAEVENQIKIGEFLNGTSSEGWSVSVPEVDRGLMGEQFFADEYIEGEHPKEKFLNGLLASGDLRGVAKVVYRSLFRMILILGRYHADLHAGNLKVDLLRHISAFLDFGNTGSLSEKNAESFILLLGHASFGSSGPALDILKNITAKSGWNASVEQEVSTVFTDPNKTADQKLRAARTIFDRHKITFEGEFEVLFKVLDTIGYLSDNLTRQDKQEIIEQVIQERQAASFSRLFSKTTFELAKMKVKSLFERAEIRKVAGTVLDTKTTGAGLRGGPNSPNSLRSELRSPDQGAALSPKALTAALDTIFKNAPKNIKGQLLNLVHSRAAYFKSEQQVQALEKRMKKFSAQIYSQLDAKLFSTKDEVYQNELFLMIVHGTLKDWVWRNGQDGRSKIDLSDNFKKALDLVISNPPRSEMRLSPGVDRIRQMLRRDNLQMVEWRKQYPEEYDFHQQKTTALIRRMMTESPQGSLLILGLGPGIGESQILEELAKKFESITVVDLDTETVNETLSKLPAGLREKFEVRQEDLSGVLEEVTAGFQRVIGQAATPTAATIQLTQVLKNITTIHRLQGLQNQYAGALSSLIGTQLGSYIYIYMDELLVEHYGPPTFANKVPQNINLEFMAALSRLSPKLIQKHYEEIRDAVSQQGRIYLADTTAQIDLVRDDKGRIKQTSQPKLMVNPAQLIQLNGLFSQVTPVQKWTWQRQPPGLQLGEKGSEFQVEAHIFAPRSEVRGQSPAIELTDEDRQIIQKRSKRIEYVLSEGNLEPELATLIRKSDLVQRALNPTGDSEEIARESEVIVTLRKILQSPSAKVFGYDLFSRPLIQGEEFSNVDEPKRLIETISNHPQALEFLNDPIFLQTLEGIVDSENKRREQIAVLSSIFWNYEKIPSALEIMKHPKMTADNRIRYLSLLSSYTGRQFLVSDTMKKMLDYFGLEAMPDLLGASYSYHLGFFRGESGFIEFLLESGTVDPKSATGRTRALLEKWKNRPAGIYLLQAILVHPWGFAQQAVMPIDEKEEDAFPHWIDEMEKLDRKGASDREIHDFLEPGFLDRGFNSRFWKSDAGHLLSLHPDHLEQLIRLHHQSKKMNKEQEFNPSEFIVQAMEGKHGTKWKNAFENLEILTRNLSRPELLARLERTQEPIAVFQTAYRLYQFGFQDPAALMTRVLQALSYDPS